MGCFISSSSSEVLNLVNYIYAVKKYSSPPTKMDLFILFIYNERKNLSEEFSLEKK